MIRNALVSKLFGVPGFKCRCQAIFHRCPVFLILLYRILQMDARVLPEYGIKALMLTDII